LLKLSYWGKQHRGAADFFHGDAESGWVKLMRVRVRVGDDCFYPELRDTKLYPFGLTSRCSVAGVKFVYELLLLPDALVQRVELLEKPKVPVKLEMLHQEACCASSKANRKWDDFAFDPGCGALVASCVDGQFPNSGDTGLAQAGFKPDDSENTAVRTWVAIACDGPLEHTRGYHPRSKYYLSRQGDLSTRTAFYTVFATDKEALERRLETLRGSVHDECAALLQHYQADLRRRPKITTGDAVLDSAFNQYPAVIDSMKLPEMPGATRATVSGYFVWGWDGMTPTISSALSNDASYLAEILRFFQRTIDPVWGIAHSFTSTFHTAMKGPFPSQAQFICGLYQHYSVTGNLDLVRELLPTVELILERCRATEVKGSGLVAGYALWPDFPEAMEENGDDISSMNNSLLYQGLRAMEALYAALGESAKAEDCHLWAARLRGSFDKHLFDEEHGFFISSCSASDFHPRRHYCAQAVFWLTPFASELVSRRPGAVVKFLDGQLRSPRCLLTLPHWDSAWMADGNQLGSSFPAADHFYLNVHNLVGDPAGLAAWSGDVEWFWLHHTAPEAFTPEAENEEALGPDNPGCKQLQAVTTWYTGAFTGLAGMEFDHEGLTFNPCGRTPIEIKNLRLRGCAIDLKVSGSGASLKSLKLNGRELGPACHKIGWDMLGKKARIELARGVSDRLSVLRADGLRVSEVSADAKRLRGVVEGGMSGELLVSAPADATALLDGKPAVARRDDCGRLRVEIPAGPPRGFVVGR